MTVSSEINAAYYAMRLINHRIDISLLRAQEMGGASSEEFTLDERTLAFEIIEKIQRREGSPIQSFSESKAKFHLNALANKVEKLADREVTKAGYKNEQADAILEALRSRAVDITETYPINRQFFPAPPCDDSDIFDVVCFSHLRWDFVYQRPQHLLTRCAEARRVFFFEEPVHGAGPLRLEVKERGRVRVVVPHLPESLTSDVAREAALRSVVERMLADHGVEDYVLWYYTPMALQFTRHLRPRAVVYDCMDELSAFRGASPLLRGLESELMSRADLVFTGGRSLYEAKRDRHPRVYAFPSSIDAGHFRSARGITEEPADQAAIPHPRLGFFGVMDERLDVELLGEVARMRPGWQIVMVGPVVKIDPACLPRGGNIHYLGMKAYGELPAYLSGWDVALLPFARNESTRFISPTKTPEYLAAGRPVVSTSIRDVVRPYGERGLVRIADTAAEFVAACEEALGEEAAERQGRADAFLARASWDATWAGMSALIDGAVAARRASKAASKGAGGGGASLALNSASFVGAE